MLAEVTLAGITGRWHRLALRFEGAVLTALVDGKPVMSATDTLYPAGMAGLLAGAAGDRLSMPYFDNFMINSPGGAMPSQPQAQAQAIHGQTPIYAELIK